MPCKQSLLPALDCAREHNGLSGGARQVRITRQLDQLKTMEENANTKANANDVDAVISLFSHASSGSIDPGNLFAALPKPVEAFEVRRLRDWAISKGCAAKDFDRAARNWRLAVELGRVPQHEADFIAAFAESRRIKARYDGSLDRPRDDSDFAIDYTRVDLHRDAMLTNARLNAGFDKSLIGLAIDQWINDAKRAYLADIWTRIDDPAAPRCEAEWVRLIDAFVDTRSVSAGYAVAVVRKFIWQVKRKMKGWQVSDHLMPVWTGMQGNGKSTLTELLLEPIRGCERRVNFTEMTDGRNIEMWSSFVLFADEMEKAAKADIEAIKNAITGSRFSKRIFNTQSMAQVSQNATFIGATNGTLGTNIRDTTGLRRFAPVPTLKKPGHGSRTVDWGVINSIDFTALWQSVQIDDPDPMADHINELEALQEEEREKTPVELWLDEVDLSAISQWDCEQDGSIKASALFAQFRQFEQQNCPGVFRFSSQAWGREMKRLLDLNPSTAKFARKRAGDGWRYTPSRPLDHSGASVVKLRDSLRKAG